MTNTTPWQKGFTAGRLGKPLEACPYFGTMVWEWICGYLDGQTKRLRLVDDHPVKRQDL